ncbi:MAG: hypothetical protein FJ241_07360 [Nitrospira sp.]|nr:hypothetical protein [Nitrospira sp.]
MSTLIYGRLKQAALASAENLGIPSFYYDNKTELAASRESLKTNMLLKKCMSYMDETSMYSGHGISHAEAVAVDAGVVIQIEGRIQNVDFELLKDLVVYVQIAALFHDIKRKEKNHTIAGSDEARRILKGFQIEERYKRYIADAIRNHEAFKKVLESEDEIGKLISDSLYDADKFRWGPDNFITTLWLILDSADVPFETFCENFHKNIHYIERIKTTFRTETGRKYGPEFIDMGIMIGQAIYKEMLNIVHLQ